MQGKRRRDSEYVEINGCKFHLYTNVIVWSTQGYPREVPDAIKYSRSTFVDALPRAGE